MKFLRLTLLVFAIVLVMGPLGDTTAAPQGDVVGFWTINLEPGFNLVSFPVLPDTPTLDNVFTQELGAVEITTWDSRIGRYRWARYNPEDGNWSGDLFHLARGISYWINMMDAEGQMSLRVAGHPEQYTRFQWKNLGNGWDFYGPIIGRQQELTELPPEANGSYLVNWNNELNRFELAEAYNGNRWYSPDFITIEPDQGYMYYRAPSARTPRSVTAGYGTSDDHVDPYDDYPTVDGNIEDERTYHEPPWPLIVGNREGLAVCFENGDACGAGMVVNVVREKLRLGIEGNLEPYAENMGQYEIIGGGVEPGKFRVALSISDMENTLNPGDRVYLLVEGPEGSTTRSTSFEIPYQEHFIPDISFPQPLTRSDQGVQTPQAFDLSSPYPNPFNDRFSLEFNLPETAPVEYRMFDINGREVYSMDRPMTAGLHRLTISAGNLSAGVYVFEVKAGAHRGMTKVAHLK